MSFRFVIMNYDSLMISLRFGDMLSIKMTASYEISSFRLLNVQFGKTAEYLNIYPETKTDLK